MRVAVAGGTGVVGRYVVQALTDAGHQPVVLARSRGVDALSGKGLDDALSDVGACIDVTNVLTLHRRTSVAFFSTVTRNLLAAGQRAGVAHHVALSIVGVDRVGSGYYEGKRRQEDLVLTGPVPGTVLRATQFHEFPGQVMSGMRGPVAVIPRMRVQPVAAREVGSHLAKLAVEPAGGLAAELAGPQQHELIDLARRLVTARNLRRRLITLRMPGTPGRRMADGGLLPLGEGPRGRVTFEEWLAGGD